MASASEPPSPVESTSFRQLAPSTAGFGLTAMPAPSPAAGVTAAPVGGFQSRAETVSGLRASASRAWANATPWLGGP